MKNLVKLVALIATILGAACSTVPPRQPTVSSVINRSLAATIILYTQDGELVCSGERISPTKIVTARHCAAAATFTLEDLRFYSLLSNDDEFTSMGDTDIVGKMEFFSTYEQSMDAGGQEQVPLLQRQSAFVTAVDYEHDMAILRTEPSKQPYVELRKDGLLVGEEVYAVGHPLGLEFTYSRGYVSVLCRYLDPMHGCWTQADIHTNFGSSGGGLYDMDGRLVGVTSRGAGDGLEFFSRPDDLVAIANRR